MTVCLGGWIHIPKSELVQTSDLIVIGTLERTHRHRDGRWIHGAGEIVAEEVIWGACEPGDTLDLRWLDVKNVVCPRVAHEEREGRRLLWLLQEGDSSTVRADYPGRCLDPDEADVVRSALTEYPISLRTPGNRLGLFRDMEPVTVSLRFRNAGDRPIVLPCLMVEEGTLVRDSRISLRLRCGDMNDPSAPEISPRHRPITRDSFEVTLAPGGHHFVEFDVRDVFSIEEPGGYRIWCDVVSFEPSNAVFFEVMH